jgi:hypothetical protein
MIALRACGSKTNAAEPWGFLHWVDVGRVRRSSPGPEKLAAVLSEELLTIDGANRRS